MEQKKKNQDEWTRDLDCGRLCRTRPIRSSDRYNLRAVPAHYPGTMANKAPDSESVGQTSPRYPCCAPDPGPHPPTASRKQNQAVRQKVGRVTPSPRDEVDQRMAKISSFHNAIDTIEGQRVQQEARESGFRPHTFIAISCNDARHSTSLGTRESQNRPGHGEVTRLVSRQIHTLPALDYTQETNDTLCRRDTRPGMTAVGPEEAHLLKPQPVSAVRTEVSSQVLVTRGQTICNINPGAIAAKTIAGVGPHRRPVVHLEMIYPCPPSSSSSEDEELIISALVQAGSNQTKPVARPTTKQRQREKKRARKKAYRENVKRRVARQEQIQDHEGFPCTVSSSAGPGPTPATDNATSSATVGMDYDSHSDDPLSDDKVRSSLREAVATLEEDVEESSRGIKEMDDPMATTSRTRFENVNADFLEIEEVDQSDEPDSPAASTAALPRGKHSNASSTVCSDEGQTAHSSAGRGACFTTPPPLSTPPPSPAPSKQSTFFTPIDSALAALELVSCSKHQSFDHLLQDYKKDFFEQHQVIMTLDKPHPNPSGVPVEEQEGSEQAPKREGNHQKQEPSQIRAPEANKTEGREPISPPQQKDSSTDRPSAERAMVDEAVQTNMEAVPQPEDNVGLDNPTLHPL